MDVYAASKGNLADKEERRMRMHRPDSVETGGDHLLEDVEPELPHGKAEGVEFTRADRYVNAGRLSGRNTIQSPQEDSLIVDP